MRLLVSEKVFQNKGAILRPFSARDAKAEGIRVGRELGMQGHALSTQRTILQKELLGFIGQQNPGLPFRFCRVSDVFDLFLALSGEKPASIILYLGRPSGFLEPTRLTIGKYAPIYARTYDSAPGSKDLILSRDLGLLGRLHHLLSSSAKQGKFSEEEFRTQGFALGYPKSAVEAFASFAGKGAQTSRHIRLLLENNITITPPLWNASYLSAISGGRILETGHLESWNSILPKEMGQFAFDIASAHNKIYKMELLNAGLQGKTAWAEEPGERNLREAIENAYGVPLSVGY